MASTSGVSGVGGLDIPGLVQASTAAQQQKVKANETDAKQYQDQITGYKELDKALSGLDKAALDLSENGTVLAANSSNASVVSAKATGAGGDVGDHEINVQQPATFHTLASKPLKDGLIPTKIAQPVRGDGENGGNLGAARQSRLEDRLKQAEERAQKSAEKADAASEAVPQVTVGEHLTQGLQQGLDKRAQSQDRQAQRLQGNLDQVQSRHAGQRGPHVVSRAHQQLLGQQVRQAERQAENAQQKAAKLSDNPPGITLGKRASERIQQGTVKHAASQKERVARLQQNLDQVTKRQEKQDAAAKPLKDAGDKIGKVFGRFMPAEPKREGPLRPGAPSPDLIMGPGALWVSVGGKGFLVEVTPDKMTLGDVRDAINNAKGNKGAKGVTASVVYGTEGARLVLRANEAGDDRQVKVQALAVPGSGLATLDSRRMETLNEGQEALLTVDGVEVKGRTNTLSNVIPGVALTIAGPGKATVKVQADSENAKKSLQSFADAYNAYLNTIDQLEAGPLKGDMTLSTVRNDVINSLMTPPPVQSTLTKLPGRLASALGNVPVVGEQLSSAAASLQTPAEQAQQRIDQITNNGNEGQFQYLADIGVALQKDGTMKVDQQTLETALNKSPGSVNALLTAPMTSAGSRVDRAIRQLRNTEGAVYNTQNQLKEQVRTNQQEAEQLNQDLKEAQDYYTQKYSDLNSTLSQANTTSNMVAQRLGGASAGG